MCPHADNPAVERAPLAGKATNCLAEQLHDFRCNIRLMLPVPPAARPIVHRNFYPVNGDCSAVLLDVIAANDSIEHDFEIARVLRIVRVNRHAETED